MGLQEKDVIDNFWVLCSFLIRGQGIPFKNPQVLWVHEVAPVRNGKWPVILPAILLMALILNPFFMHEQGDAYAWTDGNKDSPVYPHYGIVDLIADQAYRYFNSTHPEKAEFLYYWYKWDGADSDDDSFDVKHTIPTSDDNFLAWTDDGQPDGDKSNYFIHHGKTWIPLTDAPSEAQKWANWTMQNLTRWFMEGKPTVSLAKHRAAYCTARMSRYVGKMSQYGRTDYSQWDQVRELPDYDPNTASYQEYYEALLWTDDSMTSLVTDYRSADLGSPMGLNASRIHIHTSDVAKWVNSRDGSTVQMIDENSEQITVGKTYKEMLYNFMYCWDNNVRYKDVRGFNGTLWNLTLENLVAATENLTSMYSAIYDAAWQEFLRTSPELVITDYSVLPGTIIANDEVIINATVRNKGPTDTRTIFLVELTTSSGHVTTRPITLQAGQEKTVSFTPFPVGDGPLDITIRADSRGDIAESDETNNQINFQIDPVSEVFTSELALSSPFDTIRRDTVQPVELTVRNTGNRYDDFYLNASSSAGGITFIIPKLPVGVSPSGEGRGKVYMVTQPDTPLGSVIVRLKAVGGNSTADLDISVEILERTRDPLPVITGPSWSRLDEIVTLSASGSEDPDGDILTFKWMVPGQGNFTTPEISFNYTREGLYGIVLEVYDGNATAVMNWPFEVFPGVPDNISAGPNSRGVSGITVSWKPWRAGGLIAYWLEATALPGQGELSNRGPYTARIGPGNNTGRVGKFLPGTEVEIRVNVEAERFGNQTTDIVRTSTSNTSGFRNDINMYVEDAYLYIQYRPWNDIEGERDPGITVERFVGEYIALDEDDREDIQRTNRLDTIRYKLKANWGTYRASFTYYWANETISPFSVDFVTQKGNVDPWVNLTGTNIQWELNINGTCRVNLQIGVDDPYDTLTATIDWGDGTLDDVEFSTPSSGIYYQPIFHNYTAVGSYPVSIRIEDWSGAVTWQNYTIDVGEYRPVSLRDPDEKLWVKIVIAIIASIFILAFMIGLGYIGYKFAKKESEVEFDLKDLRSDLASQKPGTGTDFDQRRSLQIPKESIMRAPEEDKEAEKGGITEAKKPLMAPLIKGKIVFDDDEE